MAYHAGRAKPVWTGELAKGVEPGGDQDDRICWHVVFDWRAMEQHRKHMADLEEKYGKPNDEGVKAMYFSDLPRDEMRALLEPSIVGWANVVDEHGQDLPYSAERAFGDGECPGVDTNHLVELSMRLGERNHQLHVKIEQERQELLPTPGSG